MGCHKELYLHAAFSSLLLMPIWLQSFSEPGLALMSQGLLAAHYVGSLRANAAAHGPALF